MNNNGLSAEALNDLRRVTAMPSGTAGVLETTAPVACAQITGGDTIAPRSRRWLTSPPQHCGLLPACRFLAAYAHRVQRGEQWTPGASAYRTGQTSSVSQNRRTVLNIMRRSWLIRIAGAERTLGQMNTRCSWSSGRPRCAVRLARRRALGRR